MDLSVKQVVGVIIAIVIFAVLVKSGIDYSNANTQQMETQTEKAWNTNIGD